MKILFPLLAALLLSGCATAVAVDVAEPKAAAANPLPTLAEKTTGLERHEGLLAFYPDPRAGRLWLEVPPATGERGEVGRYLYVEGLVTGLGSNPIGLDRGQLGESRLVVLRRLANRVLIEQPNLGFRALSDDEAERSATRDSFAPSVLWAGTVEAEDADGRALVDLTSFLIRDAHGVVESLKQTEQGSFALDAERSALELDHCLGFPDNVEMRALLTYAGSGAGNFLRATAPSADAFTLVQHHSFVRLPDDGYEPRVFDPRAGSFAIYFQDYATALDEPLERRWIVRHRLRATPDAEPELVYYVDPGIPEPVRGAVLDGARWWARAFDEAGFPGAYRVELLPPDRHPLDVRYNVIQWVHRSTRGWSYGGGVTDPRTGEMIKGHVSLGSLRVRQDRLLFEGLLGTENTGSGAADDPVELALARIRQLSAHEVGHTLGLAHNFAASTYGGRASVMDYPAPLVLPTDDGGLDVSRAYGVGVGEWDVHAIRYAYAELSAEGEAAALAEIVEEGLERGLVMISDADARPSSAALPAASLWDNGDDAVAQLELEMEVRRRALAAFGERNIAPGRPLATLEEVLVPLYLRHRYQLEAAVKTVGGVDYRYALRGDSQPRQRALPGDTQRRAIAAVLATLAPAELDLPESVLALVHPRPFGYWPNRELFNGLTRPTFDPLSAAATAADLAVSGLLDPGRAARLVDQHRRDPSLPGLSDVLERLVDSTFTATPAGDARRAEIARTVESVVATAIAGLASESASPAVRSRAEAALAAVGTRLEDRREADTATAHEARLAREIHAFLNRELPPATPSPGAPSAPPGSPIGAWSTPATLGECSLSGGDR